MFDTWVMHEGWLWVGMANTVGLGLDIGIHTSFIRLAIASSCESTISQVKI